MEECTKILSLFTADVLLKIDKDGDILGILLNTKYDFDISELKNVYQIFSPEEKVRVKRAIAMGFNSRKKFMEINKEFGIDQYVDVEVAQYKDGTYMFIRFFVSNRQKEVEYERYVENLLNLSEKDPLTQAYNRHGLFEKVRKLISFSDPEKKIGIIFVDLDNLKSINDTQGHKAGDKALLSITKILVSTVRQRDIIARIGGDEFAIVVEEMSGSQSTAYGLAQRLVKEFQKQKTKDSVTASLGVHVFKIADLLTNSKKPEEFEKAFSEEVAKADDATYSAKQAGKNQFKVSKAFSENYNAESIASK